MFIKKIFGILILAGVAALSGCAPTNFRFEKPLDQRSKQDVIDQWQEDRFGIFMHWGASSQLNAGAGSWCRANNYSGRSAAKGSPGNKTQETAPDVITSGEYLKYKGKRPVPQEVYDNLHHSFNPSGFNADEWAQLFQDSGAGYIVFTAKHHDGFCMFDTKTQDYNIINTPFGRDVAKELSDACRAKGIRVFWYYSPVDWWHPDWLSRKDTAYEDQAFLPQVEELVSKYGPIEGIWWDGNQITKKYADKVVDIIKKHQPWAILNSRLGGGISGDFNTPEQKLGEFNMKRRWESCITMTGSSWFWNGGTNYKSTKSCINTLIQCAVGDGNLLLDVGPRSDGRIDERAAETYRAMGAWLQKYGQSIRGTRGGPYKPGAWGGSTRSGKKVYLHITQILEDLELVLPALPAKILSAKTLNGSKVSFEQTNKSLKIKLAEQTELDVIVELTLASDSMAIDAISTVDKHSLTDDAEGVASSLGGRRNSASCIVHHSWAIHGAKLQFGEPGYEKQQAVLAKKPKSSHETRWSNHHIGHPFRFWQASSDDKNPWIELNLDGEKTFSKVYIWEKFSYTQSFSFEVYSQGQWKTIFTEDDGMGIYNRKLKVPVTSRKIRIKFTKCDGPVSVNAIKLFK